MKYSELLTSIVNQADEVFSNVSLESWNYKSSPTTWSKKEILGHLIDSAYNNHQRFLRAESQGNLIFQGYDQVDWVTKHSYQSRETKEIIQQWRLCNLHLAELIGNLSSEVLRQQTTDHNFDKIGFQKLDSSVPSSLNYLIWDYLFHLEHHIAQIDSSYLRKLSKDSFPKG